MIVNNQWKPEVPRPELTEDEELFKQFLAEWVKKEYAEELADELEVTKSGIYQGILKRWNGYDDDAAESLIKWEGWDYRSAKEFEEKGLSFDIDNRERELAIEWIKENGYTLPFPVGSRVSWRKYEGIIQPDNRDLYLKQGLVCVLTDDQAEENQRNEENGIAHQNGGYLVKWEDLILITD